jgi:ferritin-like metal-binding protein YciE
VRSFCEEDKDTTGRVLDWLNDAYAMERGIEITLRKQAENEDALRERARIHLDETTEHADRVARCLEMLGTPARRTQNRDGAGVELGKGLTTMFARDERVKDFLAAYGTEYFEVACYNFSWPLRMPPANRRSCRYWSRI